MAFDAAAWGEGGGRGRGAGRAVTNPLNAAAAAAPAPAAAAAAAASGTEGELSTMMRRVMGLAQISSTVADLIPQLGTAADTVTLRARLTAALRRGDKLRGESDAGLGHLRGIAAEAGADATFVRSVERLTTQYLDIRKSFGERQQLADVRQRQFEVRPDPPGTAGSGTGFDGAGAGAAGGRTSAGRRRPGGGDDDAAAAIELQRVRVLGDVDEAIARERREKAEVIAEAAIDLRDTTRDIAVMVEEQGEVLDVVETNVDTARSTVIAANKDLVKAESLQSSYRKKCVLFVLLILALIAAVLIPILLHVIPKQ